MPYLNTDLLQWLGCATGVSGSLLLASKTRHSGWGFVLFLISNGFWAAYGIATQAPGLLGMQIVFTITSTVGIYRWLISPGPLTQNLVVIDPMGDAEMLPSLISIAQKQKRETGFLNI